jgi:hypothetical protein
VSNFRRDPLLVIGALLLAAAVAVDIASLTTAPPLFGDEAWIGSQIASFGSGGGFSPGIATSLGIYSGHDYWASQVGSLPFIFGELVGPSTFTYYRAISLVTALIGVVVFWLGLRRAHGAVAACFGGAALVASWAFLGASHWIRWDSTGMLFACAILAILLWAPPRAPAAGAVGLLIGLSSDFVYPMVGLAAGAALLVGLDPEGRWRRLAALGCGFAVGIAVFLAIHVLPDPERSREQFNAIYRPIYGGTPLIEAVKHASLTPILDESQRYSNLLVTDFRPDIFAIATGLLAGLLALLGLMGVDRRRLARAGFPALGLFLCVTIADHTGLYESPPWLLDALRFAIFALLAACVAAIVALAVRGRPEYPRAAVAPILLANLLVAFALLHAYKYGTYANFAVPFSVAAIIAAAEQLAPVARRPLAVAALLAAFMLAGGSFVVKKIDAATPEPALDDGLSRVAREIVPPGQTVIGDWIYWWLYRDQRFQINSSIWFQAYEHRGESFRDSFDRVCPDYVLLDDIWLGRYVQPEKAARIWPNLAPSDPRERLRLMRLLHQDYRRVRALELDGRHISFWQRRKPACPPV